MQPPNQPHFNTFYTQPYSFTPVNVQNDPQHGQISPPDESASLSTSQQSYDMSYSQASFEQNSLPGEWTHAGGVGLEAEAELEVYEDYASGSRAGRDDGLVQRVFVDTGPKPLCRRLTSGSSSTDSLAEGHQDVDGRGTSPKKKPRITLPRGRACVPCRKCSGEKPCRNCDKNGTECRYEEIQRKKPRAVMLEELELEALLNLKSGQPIPKRSFSDHSVVGYTPITTPSEQSMSIEARLDSAGSQTHTPPFFDPPPVSLTLLSHRDLPPNRTALNTSITDIPPTSQLELALIQAVLPHTPFLSMPVHPGRFLAILSLPPSDPNRPHPAFLYVLFSEAVRIVEQQVPSPSLPPPPSSLFPPSFEPLVPPPCLDRNIILSQVGGTSVALLERARSELDLGIRNVDRPFDLARAAIGIARALYSRGRFIEGWNIPAMRLVTSCGLHRLTGTYIPPAGSIGPGPGGPEIMPPHYAPSHQYRHAHVPVYVTPGQAAYPSLRMRPVIVPPARDEIEVAERVMTFWAAKMQDWESGIGWGWTLCMSDEQATTQWPWGWGHIRPRIEPFGIRDLYEPMSTMHTSPQADTTYLLATKSTALLHRANSLFDLPIASHPVPLPDGRVAPTYLPPLADIQSIETALQIFRQRIPLPFHDVSRSSASTPSHPGTRPEETYDGPSDPWWICLHANLYVAEMLMYKEMANYRPEVYETSVSCARALVGLVQRIPQDKWANVDMLVALDISLASRFLFKEANRLISVGQAQAATFASEEAEILRTILAGPLGKWLPMAGLHSMIVQRVREGWPEKEGEYERV
ncbi:hypothetical protein CI109_102319 [Kwoniella shandongensis]|uniref:Zn(2)-C6 fungal-type domain-containing protein n=1 Tax=Kwoniella shandongensis TaxID=1734106 RepID=A0AAJ8MVT1_9TREE